MSIFDFIKTVRAGRIVETAEHGCYVQEANSTSAFRGYEAGMVSRRTPVVGDYWVIYEDGYQSISPGILFEKGYVLKQ